MRIENSFVEIIKLPKTLNKLAIKENNLWTKEIIDKAAYDT